jgi:hypothetical protein
MESPERGCAAQGTDVNEPIEKLNHYPAEKA